MKMMMVVIVVVVVIGIGIGIEDGIIVVLMDNKFIKG